MKFLKKNLKFIIGLIVGGIIASGATAYAFNTYATQIDYTRNGETTTVANALDDLYNKSTSSKGYVALFKGRSVMNTSTKTLPLEYGNSDYVTSNNNTITMTKNGKYQIIATPIHARSGCTTVVRVYKNNAVIITSWLNWDAGDNNFNIGNLEIDLVAGDKIRVDYYSDGNDSSCNTTGGTVVIINK